MNNNFQNMKKRKFEMLNKENEKELTWKMLCLLSEALTSFIININGPDT